MLPVMEMVQLLWLNADNYIHCAEFQVTKYLRSCTELRQQLAPSQDIMKNMNDNGMEKFYVLTALQQSLSTIMHRF